MGIDQSYKHSTIKTRIHTFNDQVYRSEKNPVALIDKTINIVEGRHPVVEAMQSQTPFVPNDAYLDTDENGHFIQQDNNSFKIKDGLVEECIEARNELNNFEIEVNLRTIPAHLLEDMEFTPKQLAALEMLIEEE